MTNRQSFFLKENTKEREIGKGDVEKEAKSTVAIGDN